MEDLLIIEGGLTRIKNQSLNKKALPIRTKLEDHQPGASRTLVLDALKKVSKSPKPCEKHGGQPVSTSKGT